MLNWGQIGNLRSGPVPSQTRAMADAEEIKGARLRNAMAGEQLQLTAEAREKREALQRYMAASESQGEVIRQLRADGHHDIANKMADSARERVMQEAKIIDAFGETLAAADNPSKAYKEFRYRGLREGWLLEDSLPAEYSSSRLKKEAEMLRRKARTFRREVVETGRDRRPLVQDVQIDQMTGREISRSPTYDPRASNARPRRPPQPKRLKGSDTSTMLKMLESSIPEPSIDPTNDTPRAEREANRQRRIMGLLRQAETRAATGMPLGAAVQSVLAEDQESPAGPFGGLRRSESGAQPLTIKAVARLLGERVPSTRSKQIAQQVDALIASGQAASMTDAFNLVMDRLAFESGARDNAPPLPTPPPSAPLPL